MDSVEPPVFLSNIDEERFGVRIARASQVTATDLPSVIDFCLANEVALLIARCDTRELPAVQAMESEGFALMGTLVYYERDLRRATIPQDFGAIAVRPVKISEEDGVGAVAARAFRGYLGHYHADPRLDRSKCDEVYVSWAVRSCLLREVADEVLVAERGGRIVGFAALRLKNPQQGDVVLLGVDPAVQHQGILRVLLIHSMQWCLSKGGSGVTYSTQLSNFAVQKALTRLGFEPRYARYTFHKWFAGGTTTTWGTTETRSQAVVPASSQRGSPGMDSQAPIPFNRASVEGNEYAYIAEAVANGHISGDGPFTRKCHELLQKELGVQKALLTTSCTDALEMAALLLEIKPGDEVIVPSFTFVSTVNAFVLRGARPVFVDIRPDTLNLDESQLGRLITPRTRAIVVVHYAGVACEMDAILGVAGRHGVPVVEDNAHALFGKYKGKFLGTFGCLATQSFHETKNLTSGEGGALLINDPRFIERAEIIREKGTNRSRFFRGQVDKYTWVDIGSSYLPSDVLAAFLYAQLEARQRIQHKRRCVWNNYHRLLQGWVAEYGIRLPVVTSGCEQPYHMFYLLLPSLEMRQALIAHLKSRGIMAVFHYLPLHLSEMGRRFGGKPGDFPITENMSDRLLRLPFYNSLTESDQARIVAAVRESMEGVSGE